MDLEVIPSTCRNNQPTWISPHHLTGHLNNTKHIQSVSLWTELGIAEPTKILNKQQFEKRYFWISQKKVSDKVTPKHLTLCPNQTQDTRILWRIGQIGLLLPGTEIPTSFVRNWPQASLKTTHMMMDGWQSNWDIHWEEAIMKCSWTKPYRNISV